MRPDGLADLARLSAWAVAPNGERLPLKVERGDQEFHLLRFTPDQEGFWAVVVKNDAGPIAVTRDGLYRRGTRKDYPDARDVGYYYQYAKTYLQVGHLHAACGKAAPQPEVVRLGHDLELIVIPGAYRVGEEATVEVCCRGRPLPGVEVRADWSQRKQGDWALAASTDAAGRVRFSLCSPGHWLFYAAYADESQKAEGEYDKRVYAATFGLFGVRQPRSY